MSLQLEELHFSSFRNYECLDIEGLGSLTILIGPNGSGKTNILEGISLLTSGVSFRHPMVQQMIREGSDEGFLKARSQGDGRVLDIEVDLEAGKKRFLLNGKAKNAADMKGVLPSVSFVPDDLDIAKRSSSVRRDAIDDLGCQLSRNYYIVRRDYMKALRYKNRLLKEEAPSLMIESIDDTLITCATQLFYYRYELFSRMQPVLREIYERITPGGEEFSSCYVPSWVHLEGDDGRCAGEDCNEMTRDEVKSLIESALQRWKNEEGSRKRALVGPHNDKIRFFLDGRGAADFASQGQQRSIVLAWKLAEVEMVRRSLGVYPVLLLDDVMSELDSTRRSMLIDLVHQDIQTFITATDLSYFPDDVVEKARIIDIGCVFTPGVKTHEQSLMCFYSGSKNTSEE